MTQPPYSIDMFPDSFIEYVIREKEKAQKNLRVDTCRCPEGHPAHRSVESLDRQAAPA